jgi:two-component system response regulator AtoC
MKTIIKQPSCKQIIDILPDPFVVIDRDYQIMSANQQYMEHYGYSNLEDVVGKHCYEVSHHVDSPCSQHGEHCPLETVFETGKATQVMHIHYDQNGTEEHVQLNTSPLFDENGQVLYIGENIYPIPQQSENSILLGRSSGMIRMVSMLQRVAPTQTTVLLLGESGVGKECVANYIHQYSNRSQHPFVIVDCGVLGDQLIESELFGHEKGAFTGATSRKIGLFESAHGGTLVIDEIGELPLALQTKLLRVLESSTIRRLGGSDYINIDVRIIAATNKNLQEMVQDGTFRQDLYYRLSAFPVTIPSLRERLDDIAPLAENFLRSNEDGARFLPLSATTIEHLMSYDYPGNVRELRNIIERAAILAFGSGGITADHIIFENEIPLRNRQRQHQGRDGGMMSRGGFEAVHDSSDEGLSMSDMLKPRGARLSDESVIAALKKSGGHRTDAARLLGVSERTLYRYVQKLREA